MKGSYLEGIDNANEEIRKQRNVESALNSLVDAIGEMERVTGVDMTTECIMRLLEENK